MLFCLSSEIDLVSCWLHTSCWSSKNTLGSAVPLAMFDNDIFLSVYNVHVLTSQNATNVTTTRTAWYDFINSKMWFEVERNTIIYKSDKCFNPHHKFRFGILHWPTKISVGCKPSCGEDVLKALWRTTTPTSPTAGPRHKTSTTTWRAWLVLIFFQSMYAVDTIHPAQVLMGRSLRRWGSTTRWTLVWTRPTTWTASSFALTSSGMVGGPVTFSTTNNFTNVKTRFCQSIKWSRRTPTPGLILPWWSTAWSSPRHYRTIDVAGEHRRVGHCPPQPPPCRGEDR